jgi:hypothetical protein
MVMAKVTKKGVARKARRDTINAAEFVKIYKPLAEAGKSAKEIGEALGRDATYVCVKATTLRAAIKTQCEARKFSDEQTATALANVPKLSGRGGGDVLKMLGIVE